MLIITYLLLFVFIIGCCIGSFLNVVILRAFSGESIVFPASKCPKCNTKLKWYHNVPIFSYILLKGKCAFCGEKISIQYPIIEFLTGIMFVACALKFKYNIVPLIFSWYFVSLFIVLAVCDIKEKVIFDFHTYFLIAGGLILNFFNSWNLYFGYKPITLFSINFCLENSFIYALIGIAVGVVVMEILARSGYLIAGTRAFGEGDSYIAAGLGAIFGWKYVITVIIYAFIVQVIFTFPLYIKKLFMEKDVRTLVGFSIFMFSIISILLIEKYAHSKNIYFAFLVLLTISGIYICKRVITNLKNSSTEQSLTFLPFGPAMVLGAIYLMFSI